MIYMENTFCTIVTHDYLPYAIALFKSISRYNDTIELNVLIADRATVEDVRSINKINIFGSESLCADGIGKKIKDKYKNKFMDEFRWSMKPVFINYLINKRDYRNVIYVDSDIYFFNDYNFLFQELDVYDVLLSPHWRSSDPYRDPANFHTNFIDGIFNGGFIGVNRNGVDAMEWWAMVCEYECKKERTMGLYVDQGYLNLLPVYFDNVGIIKHRGCNVANWNQVECKRVAMDDGTVLINGEYPVIFIHFHPRTIKHILKGKDPLLIEYLRIYTNEVQKYAPNIDIS
jgi:hypothetical protein